MSSLANDRSSTPARTEIGVHTGSVWIKSRNHLGGRCPKLMMLHLPPNPRPWLLHQLAHHILRYLPSLTSHWLPPYFPTLVPPLNFSLHPFLYYSNYLFSILARAPFPPLWTGAWEACPCPAIPTAQPTPASDLGRVTVKIYSEDCVFFQCLCWGWDSLNWLQSLGVCGAGMLGEKRAPTSHQLNYYHIA